MPSGRPLIDVMAGALTPAEWAAIEVTDITTHTVRPMLSNEQRQWLEIMTHHVGLGSSQRLSLVAALADLDAATAEAARLRATLDEVAKEKVKRSTRLCNLNEEVTVVLNDHGLYTLNAHWNAARAILMCEDAPPMTERRRTMPLWQLMQIFGPVISHGMKQSPFIGNEITIEARSCS